MKQWLPKKLQVGPTTWRIEYSADELARLANAGADDMFGCTLPQEHRILVHEKRPLDGIKETLLHEIIHCINHVYALEVPHCLSEESAHVREERLVASLAPALLDTMQRNKKLFNWLKE
jgi:hypothetical protein